jgi:hypothetical protein
MKKPVSTAITRHTGTSIITNIITITKRKATDAWARS